jgi:ABC-type multidrug transport system fused ATPase/permease subunit
LAVLIIVPEFFLPLRQLATRYHSGAAGRVVAARAFAILDEPLPASRRGGVVPGQGIGVPAGEGDGRPPGLAISFRDVWYTYPGRTEPAVRALDLEIPAGRLTALVGVSGAGKSTIASLLLRFIEPDSGRILVGDTDLALIDPGAWRAQVAWVPQLPYLFHGGVADNIRLARPGATDAAVRAAAREAGADDFIGALPSGYDQAVGERGVRLSGGQRQRIAIARAILADARLVILDEATSQLDTASETVIRDAIRRLAGTRTVLVVSHRLRLASVADEIAVIDAGRVTESGRPFDLARRDGAYRRLLDVRQADPEREAGP